MASNLLYFSHALKLRAEAAQYMRRARTYPVGARRNEMRRIARALKSLSETEAWLDGEPRQRRQRFVSRATRPRSF